MWKDINGLSHIRWNCKYHIVFAPKYRRKEFYGDNIIKYYIRIQNNKGKVMLKRAI